MPTRFLVVLALCSQTCDAFQGSVGALVSDVFRAAMPTNQLALRSHRSLFLPRRQSAAPVWMQEDGTGTGDSEEKPIQPSSIEVSFPTPDEGVAMGIREWPGILKKDSNFEEDVELGTVRYVLEGKGTCTARGELAVEMEPGTLLECASATTLSWEVSMPMVLLTPKFEQPGLLAAGAILLFGGLGWLVANVKDTKGVKKAGTS